MPTLPEKLSLQSIRDALIRQEDTIIFALIERAQFKCNGVCYSAGAAQFRAVAGPSESFLEIMLLETERTHARVRRYTAPDEHAFFPERLPPPALPLIDFPALLHPSNVNLNSQVLEVYLRKVIPAICESGDDTQHGSSVVADVNALQAISKRVHYGLFVAESKFRSQPEEYTKLIEAGDEVGIIALLTNMAVEERVIRRVRRKAQIFGQGIEVEDSAASEAPSNLKLDPEAIVQLYHDFIIPLTKEAEVSYLLQRLGNTRVAYHGPPDGSCCQLAVQHFQRRPSALLQCDSSLAVFEALMSNRAFLGLVVLECAHSGILPATRALLSDYPLMVVGELHHTASYRLVYRAPLRAVRRVCGTAISLRACGAWVRERLAPSCALIELSEAPWQSGRFSGLLAGAEAAENDETAWLVDSATPLDGAFEHAVDVQPLGAGVASHSRYIVLCKRSELPPPSGCDKTMVLFRLADKTGNLAAALSVFHRHSVNVAYIQSDVLSSADSESGAGLVCFFMEVAGHAREPNVASALIELQSLASYIKMLGSFTPGAPGCVALAVAPAP